MAKIITFGEIMLRLQPPGYLRLTQSDSLCMSFAGAEANVAVSLANYGESAAFVTKIPDNLVGQSCINSLRRYGVDTDKIIKGGERLGIFYCEKGASQRPSVVVYDRKNSAVAMSKPDEYNWDSIFDGAEWFHFTGITPALSDSAAEICLMACKAAKQRGITISCDLNYRSKLWTREKAQKVMSTLCEYVDVCIANEEDAYDVFSIRAKNSDVQSGVIDTEGYKDSAKQLAEMFNFDYVAFTLRTSISANDNNWAGLLYHDGKYALSREYSIHIVDRVGGGDSFGAGLIFALVNSYDMQRAVEFATAASCLKQTIEGDYNQVSVDEVNRLVSSGGNGRVVR